MAISKRENQRRLIKRLKVMQKFFKKHRNKPNFSVAFTNVTGLLWQEKENLKQIKDGRNAK